MLILNMALNFMFVCNLKKSSVIIQTIYLFVLHSAKGDNNSFWCVVWVWEKVNIKKITFI